MSETLADFLVRRREAEKADLERAREVRKEAVGPILSEIERKRAPEPAPREPKTENERIAFELTAGMAGKSKPTLTDREKYIAARDFLASISDDEREELRDPDNPWWKSQPPEARRWVLSVLRYQDKKRDESALSLEDYVALEEAPESEEDEFELEDEEVA